MLSDALTAGTAFGFDEGIDLGVHYIMDGHNARLTAAWEQRNLGSVLGTDNFDAFRFGAQVQF